jgi:ribosomal-protein-alanine N-acetyltransferase
MADLHAISFAPERGWSAQEFTDLLARPYCHAYTLQAGFALARTLAGETELLTLAVVPDHRRRGHARALLAQWIAAATPHAQTAFLEVAADNPSAQALYASCGFGVSGVRKDYYRRPHGPAVDAVMMTRALTQG